MKVITATSFCRISLRELCLLSFGDGTTSIKSSSTLAVKEHRFWSVADSHDCRDKFKLSGNMTMDIVLKLASCQTNAKG